jgi:diguanylate cyclase (GGDEF)-like protein
MKTAGTDWVRRYLSAIQWFIPPAAQRTPALLSRAQNVMNAVLVALISGPFYAWIYYRLGFPAAGWEILSCVGVMLTAPFLLRATGAIALAREVFLCAVFFNFIWLNYHLGGVGAPTTPWLLTVPVVAALLGGVGPALFWLGMGSAAVVAIYFLPLAGVVLPFNPITDMQLLTMLCHLGLLPVIVMFVLLSELTKTQGFIRLEKALDLINELAIRDDLTGTHNRRHLLELVESERDRSARSGRPFCVCLLDIDFFKRINDSYGHSVGDTVLREFSLAVQRQIRVLDSFGRYGGEEFLLILPETSLAEAAMLVERIRVCIENLRFPEVAAELSLSVSTGVAQFKAAESISRTIARADEALYRAKSNGRNRVVLHGEQESLAA